ncbi:MAG: hypothetical protein GX344_04015 [Intrasporangiaceae bacterium]|nr:hypothetical protein [Intrasporangiaceae bacterium]
MTDRDRLATAVARRLRPWAKRSHASSTVLALLGYLASMSPSLLPRTWLIQGAIAGVCAAGGYALGRLLEIVFGALARWAEIEVTMSDTARRLLVWGWPTLVLIVLLATPSFMLRAHQRTAEIVGTRAPTGLDLLLGSVFAVVVFAVILGIWHGVAALIERTSAVLNRALPQWISRALAAVVVLVALSGATERFVITPFVERAVSAASTVNAGALTDPPPQSPLRSGSTASAERWETLGFEGRSFVAAGPSQEEIAAVTGEPAEEPIRVYAGLTGGRDIETAAAAVVAELERTGAFEREAILVVTTTGTGWVNEWVPSSFEFLLGGDSAVAAMQYSTLPSPIAFLQSAALPPEAGTALITAVRTAIDARPDNSRPRMFLSGESLGAYGANADFDSLDDMLDTVDGALFTGTPGFTPLLREITDSRVQSSTEVLPVVDNGAHVRFASDAAELVADQFGRALGPWGYPRVVYLQHRSDPVVWWSPELLIRSPDWLNETRQGSPAEQMSWAPFVTFWQVTADLGWANTAPPGEGHRYGHEVVPAMAAILGDEALDDYSVIQDHIADKDRFAQQQP